MKLHKLFFAVLIILGFANISIKAQITYNWNGGNGNWNTSSKWTPIGVPGVGDTAIVDSGSIILNSGNEVAAFLLNGGELKGNGLLTISYQMQWTGGLMSGGGTTEIIQGSLLEISGPNLKELNKRMLSNAGTIIWTDTGRIGLGNNAIFRIQEGGIFDFQTDAIIDDLDSSNSMIENNGLITKSAGAGIVNIDVIFNNQNRVNVETGTVRLNNRGNDNGIYDIYTASFLDFTGNNHTLNPSASLMGTGTLSFTGDTLVNNANINPGTSPGIISVNGNLQLSDSASVNIEIGGYIAGSEYDRIVVIDTAQFGGSLNATLINGFTPILSDTFRVITYTEHQGQFNSITSNNFGNGLILGKTYTSNGLILIVNYKPVAVNDSITTDEDFEISINVLANDYDPGNDSLSIIAFTQPLNGIVTQITDSSFTYFPALNYYGLDSFTYIISDDKAGLDTATVVIDVVTVNDTPVIVSIPDTVAIQDLLYSYQVIATDPDSGDVLSYYLTTAPNFLSIDTTSGLISGTPTNADTGVHAVTIRVVDSFNAADTQSFLLIVSDVNFPPVISPLPQLTFAEDDTLIHQISDWFNFVDDPDDPDNTLSYIVESGSNVIASSGNLVYFFYAPENWFGQDTLQLIVSDGFLSDTSDLYFSVVTVNDTPVIVSFPDTVAVQDLLYSYQVIAVDPDSGDVLSYFLTTAPNFLSIDTTSGLISGTPTNADTGVHAVTIRVVDSFNAADTQSFLLIVSDVNFPPVISPLPQLTFAEDDTLIHQISDWFNFVDDPDDPDNTLSYIVESGSNVIASSGNLVYFFYAPQNWFGQDTLQLLVSDGFLSDTSDLYVSVSSVNDTPVVLLPDSVIFSIDTSASILLWNYVNDIEIPDSLLNMQFSKSNDSLLHNYDSTSGIITFSAQTGFWGIVYFNVTVIDDSGAFDMDTLIIKVENVITNIEDLLAEKLPMSFSLSQNYPNPFNSITTIEFALPKTEYVRLILYNILGKEVASLVSRQLLPGNYKYTWDVSNLSSGIYYYKIEAGVFQQVRKMVLLK